VRAVDRDDLTLVLPGADGDDALVGPGRGHPVEPAQRLYAAKVGEIFDWLERQTAYGMRGRHGSGHTAETVAGTGFLGWAMVHRAARPVAGRVVGDPHWHVHVTIANLTRAGGRWSTAAAGGRDLMRHAPAVDHVLKALVRRALTDAYGVAFARSERTGAWEVAAIPDATLRAFSKRGASIEALLRDLGFDPELATRRTEDLAAAQTREAKSPHATAASDATLREQWQAEARAGGMDPDALAAAALPGAEAAAGEPTAAGGADELADELADVLARLLDPEHGLTSGRRRFTRVNAIAAVADALPAGAAGVTEIKRLTDRALAAAGIVALPGTSSGAGESTGVRQLGAGHMRNAQRYTTADVVAAEEVILDRAAAAHDGQGAARVRPRTLALARSAVEAGQGYELSAEQARALERLVTGGRAVDALLGPPGTGKTALLRTARAAWEAENYVVAGAATAAVAAQNLQVESGIGSKTAAQWVWSIKEAAAARAFVANGYVAPWAAGDARPVQGGARAALDRSARFGGLAGIDVLVLDEANLTDDRDRAVLYTEAARTGTKLVEVGDPRQLRGVGCGLLFGRVHETVGGAVLTDNRRQRDEDERAAIVAWRAGRYGQALGASAAGWWPPRGRGHRDGGRLDDRAGRGAGPARGDARGVDAGRQQRVVEPLHHQRPAAADAPGSGRAQRLPRPGRGHRGRRDGAGRLAAGRGGRAGHPSGGAEPGLRGPRRDHPGLRDDRAQGGGTDRRGGLDPAGRGAPGRRGARARRWHGRAGPARGHQPAPGPGADLRRPGPAGGRQHRLRARGAGDRRGSRSPGHRGPGRAGGGALAHRQRPARARRAGPVAPSRRERRLRRRAGAARAAPRPRPPRAGRRGGPPAPEGPGAAAAPAGAPARTPAVKPVEHPVWSTGGRRSKRANLVRFRASARKRIGQRNVCR
jgi:hypothetical protein